MNLSPYGGFHGNTGGKVIYVGKPLLDNGLFLLSFVQYYENQVLKLN
jgi:hypothetical protein